MKARSTAGADHDLRRPLGSRRRRQRLRDIVADVKSALDQGGGALFVLGLGSFLSRGGALEALKAEGFRIDAPD